VDPRAAWAGLSSGGDGNRQRGSQWDPAYSCAPLGSTQTDNPLPARYEPEWGADFWAFVDETLQPGVSILDVGAGRRPTIDPARRPPGTTYVGFDISAEELAAAAPGSYDETVAGAAETLVPGLVGRFDLIVAWQVLEHIRDLPRAVDTFSRYARPEGRFVACLSGRRAVYSIANRLLPARLGARLVARLRRRPLESVFPAHYDHCDYDGLHAAFSAWDDVQVLAFWHAADYFERLPRMQSLYLRYEDWAARTDRRGLATHYTVTGRRPADGS
jgi:SAM-dependent methyltransferase